MGIEGFCDRTIRFFLALGAGDAEKRRRDGDVGGDVEAVFDDAYGRVDDVNRQTAEAARRNVDVDALAERVVRNLHKSHFLDELFRAAQNFGIHKIF